MSIYSYLRRLLRPEDHLKPVPDGRLKDLDGEDLILSANDAAKQANAVIFSFLATTIFLAIAAGATSDEQLLLNTPLTLPLLNIGVNTESFFLIAPFLVLFLHLNLLLQEYFLAYRLHRLSYKAKDEQADRFFLLPSVTMRLGGSHHLAVRMLLRLVFMTITLALPLAVLLTLQAKFLPYHHGYITIIHQCSVLSDACLVALFFWLRPRSTKRLRTKSAHIFERFSLVGITVAALYLSLCVIRVPSSSQAPLVCESWAPGGGAIFHKHLYLPGFSISRDTKSARLWGRDFRCADFRGASLENADFRGSDLRGANFFGAKLGGAKFTPLGASGIDEVASVMPEPRLVKTRLEDSNLREADLQGADLSFAQLEDSHLDRANLSKVRLYYATLDGASLTSATLCGAELKSASLRAADLQGAHLDNATLAASKAEFAVFSGATLKNTEFSRARLMGALLPQAWRESLHIDQPEDGQWPELFQDRGDLNESLASSIIEYVHRGHDSALHLALARRVLSTLLVDPSNPLANQLAWLLRKELLRPTWDFSLQFTGHEEIGGGLLRRYYSNLRSQ